MAVTAQTPRNVSTAAVGAVSFAYDFKILAKEDLLVQVDGVTKTVDVDFTISGVGQDSGGDIEFVVPLVGGESVLRKRNMVVQRLTDFQHLGDLRSPTLNSDQDAPVMMIQQVAEEVGRAIRLPADSVGVDVVLPAPSPLLALVWNAAGTALENGDSVITGDMLLRPNLADGADPAKGAAMVAYKSAGVGAVQRTLRQELDDLHVNVKRFGATGDGVTDDSNAINAAIEYVGSNGGGTVYFPKGTYMVQDHTGDVGADKAFCIEIQHNNVHLIGAGRAATTIKQMNGALRAHVIKVGRRVGVANPVEHITIRSMTLDGNRLNISESNGQVIDVSSGCANVLIEDLHIKQAGWYGIGMQRNDFQNCRIKNVLIEDTGGDGIDWKVDTNAGSYGNSIEDVTVLRFGLAAVPGTPQAGIDVRQGVSVRNCYVGEYGGECAGFRVSLGVNDLITTVPVQRSVLENITAIASAVGTGTVGLYTGANGIKINGAHLSGNKWNVRVRTSLNLLENISTAGGEVGVHVYGDASGLPANNTFSNLMVRSATVGGILLQDDTVNHPSNNVFVNAISANNAGDTLNASVAAGITGTRFIGGSIAAGFVDLGTDTVTSGVQGLVTALKAGRNTTQHVTIDGDGVANKITGVSVGGSPKLLDIVADANSGDLRLRALGAGALIRFGTLTANADAPITGYIQIRDDGGTFRKLAVIA